VDGLNVVMANEFIHNTLFWVLLCGDVVSIVLPMTLCSWDMGSLLEQAQAYNKAHLNSMMTLYSKTVVHVQISLEHLNDALNWCWGFPWLLPWVLVLISYSPI
jgi:hypothetical protein